MSFYFNGDGVDGAHWEDPSELGATQFCATINSSLSLKLSPGLHHRREVGRSRRWKFCYAHLNLSPYLL